MFTETPRAENISKPICKHGSRESSKEPGSKILFCPPRDARGNGCIPPPVEWELMQQFDYTSLGEQWELVVAMRMAPF